MKSKIYPDWFIFFASDIRANGPISLPSLKFYPVMPIGFFELGISSLQISALKDSLLSVVFSGNFTHKRCYAANLQSDDATHFSTLKLLGNYLSVQLTKPKDTAT
jgi:hypothetical protein